MTQNKIMTPYEEILVDLDEQYKPLLEFIAESGPSTDKDNALNLAKELIAAHYSPVTVVVDTLIEEENGNLKRASGKGFGKGDIIQLATMTVEREIPRPDSDALAKVREIIIEAKALLAAMYHEQRPWKEINAEIIRLNEALALLDQLSAPSDVSTDKERAEALARFNSFAKVYAEFDGDLEIIGENLMFMMDHEETIRAALSTPQQSADDGAVDVEALKKIFSEPDMFDEDHDPWDYPETWERAGKVAGWNDCIDHLAKTGRLSGAPAYSPSQEGGK